VKIFEEGEDGGDEYMEIPKEAGQESEEVEVEEAK
jgi:hypothetical protein